MKKFMDSNFMLDNETAVKLFHEYAENMPIVDYHCHINPQEIAEDRKFENITQAWLGGDHYKWRQMRSNGIDEKYITGDASDHDKFIKWAETLEKAIGNPLYHWSHLELQRYFGYNGVLNSKTAEDVWNICNEKFKESSMSVRGLIKQSNVRCICTTDDPADTLEWHEKIAADKSFDVKVLPACRPDRAMNIEKPDYAEYVAKLGESAEVKITCLDEFEKALVNRLDYFDRHGACVSDHALDYMMYYPAERSEIEMIFRKRLAGESVTQEEELKFKTAFIIFVSKQYCRLGWVMQLHFGCKRNNNSAMFRKLGPDTGYDCINNFAPSTQMADLMNAINADGEMPKMVLYSLNPNDNQAIDSMMGCFQDSSAAGKIQHGISWWFNDHEQGMREMMISLGNLGLLGNFIGMLTDSRSFLSYTRHEYFRRIMCNLIGEWVEAGKYPDDYENLEKIVKGICYENAVKYFGFDV